MSEDGGASMDSEEGSGAPAGSCGVFKCTDYRLVFDLARHQATTVAHISPVDSLDAPVGMYAHMGVQGRATAELDTRGVTWFAPFSVYGERTCAIGRVADDENMGLNVNVVAPPVTTRHGAELLGGCVVMASHTYRVQELVGLAESGLDAAFAAGPPPSPREEGSDWAAHLETIRVTAARAGLAAVFARVACHARLFAGPRGTSTTVDGEFLVAKLLRPSRAWRGALASWVRGPTHGGEHAPSDGAAGAAEDAEGALEGAKVHMGDESTPFVVTPLKPVLSTGIFLAGFAAWTTRAEHEAWCAERLGRAGLDSAVVTPLRPFDP